MPDLKLIRFDVGKRSRTSAVENAFPDIPSVCSGGFCEIRSLEVPTASIKVVEQHLPIVIKLNDLSGVHSPFSEDSSVSIKPCAIHWFPYDKATRYVIPDRIDSNGRRICSGSLVYGD